MCSYFSLHSYSHTSAYGICLFRLLCELPAWYFARSCRTRIPKIFAKIAQLCSGARFPHKFFYTTNIFCPNVPFFFHKSLHVCDFFAFVVNQKQKCVRYLTLLHLPPSKISLCRRMLGSITGLLRLWMSTARMSTAPPFIFTFICNFTCISD